MKHKELFTLLKTLNIPVAYDHFTNNKTLIPPFMAYREIAPDTFKADNKTWYRPYEYEIELITDKKDVDLEERLEGLLDNNNIPYDKENEVWDEEEQIYHNYYII